MAVFGGYPSYTRTFTSYSRFDVFRKYQSAVHKDPPEAWPRRSFDRFLCSGLRPVPYAKPEEGGEQKQLGSHHQVYRLDGQIVAVAVLDLLPSGISSVYL